MKKYSYIFALLFLFNACEKETEEVSTIETVSYPAIQLKGAAGDSIMFVPIGGSYTEQGAILIDDITLAQTDITPESNNINTSTSGVYTVTYRAHNKFGFETVRNRFVVIYNPNIPEEDYTGNYAHENGYEVQVTKLSSRLFGVSDIYGTFTIDIPGYFVDYGDLLYIPKQKIDPSLGNFIEGKGEKSGTPGTYVLDFYGLKRDGLERPRVLTQI